MAILCNIWTVPKLARQGQIFPNSSERNQKLVERVEWNQLFVIITFFNFQNPGLRIRRPQVERSEIRLRRIRTCSELVERILPPQSLGRIRQVKRIIELLSAKQKPVDTSE
jgi:hypothetical protein